MRIVNGQHTRCDICEKKLKKEEAKGYEHFGYACCKVCKSASVVYADMSESERDGLELEYAEYLETIR